jgi:hypothetical protein
MTTHYNPLCGTSTYPAPWDKAKCGATPDFKESFRYGTDEGAVVVKDLQNDEYQQTSQIHQVDCSDCLKSELKGK